MSGKRDVQRLPSSLRRRSVLEEVFVGLDVHRSSIVATAIDREGNRVDQTKLSSTDADLVSYLNRFPGAKHVVLEACNVWPHVYDAARSVGADVTLAHPYKVRVITEASLKSDKVDSESLARLLLLRCVPMAYAPEPPVRDLRELVRDRVFYISKERDVKNHIYSILLRKGIPYEDGILALKRKRESLRELHLPEIDRGLDMLASIEEGCKDLDKEVHEAFLASKEAQLLKSIPGIGEITAVALVAELCPIDRFPNIEKLCSYAGLVPTNHQSGDASYQGHLKPDANQLVRWLLIEASWVHRYNAKRSDVSLMAKRVARRRGKQKGNIAGAHKLLKIVCAVLKRGTPYTPDRPSSVACSAKS
jgi:transposase